MKHFKNTAAILLAIVLAFGLCPAVPAIAEDLNDEIAIEAAEFAAEAIVTDGEEITAENDAAEAPEYDAAEAPEDAAIEIAEEDAAKAAEEYAAAEAVSETAEDETLAESEEDSAKVPAEEEEPGGPAAELKIETPEEEALEKAAAAEEVWEINYEYSLVNAEYFDGMQDRLKEGDAVEAFVEVTKDGEYFSFLEYSENPDTGEWEGNLIEGYEVRYVLELRDADTDELRQLTQLAAAFDGSLLFTVPAPQEGMYFLKAYFYHNGERLAEASQALTIKAAPVMPETYEIRMEQAVGYYDEVEPVCVESYYPIYSEYEQYIDVTPCLYVDGEKVSESWVGNKAYYSYDWTETSDASIAEIMYGRYLKMHGTGEFDLTAQIYYNPDRDEFDDAAYLTSVSIHVVIMNYKIATKDDPLEYNNNRMHVVGEDAVITPKVYSETYDESAREWILHYEDLADVTFEYAVSGLEDSQYAVSEDTKTLTVSSVPEGSFPINVKAYRNGSLIAQSVFYVCGAKKPASLGLAINGELENGVFANRNGISGSIFARGIGFEWGRVRFEYLDPKTKKPVTWVNANSAGGAGSPNNYLMPKRSGDALVRATLYRDIVDTETPFVTEEILLHVYSPINADSISLVKGKTFTAKASDAMATAGLKISGFQSSNTSVFTVNDAGKITAKGAGYATLNIMTDGFLFAAIPVSVYDVTLGYTTKAYTGSELKPAVKSVVGPYFFADGTYEAKHTYKAADYTITRTNNINVGTATTSINLKNGDNSTVTIKKTFTITTKAITPKVTLSATTYTYDGKVKKPTVTVKDGTTKLAAENYTVTYATGRKNPGSYKVTVKMKGNYSGTKSVTFKINPKGTSVKSLTAASKAITVNWTKQATQTTGYQVQASLTKDFKTIVGKITPAASKTSGKITGLKTGKTYYVRIRTYKTVSGTKYYSAWKVFSKTVKVK